MIGANQDKILRLLADGPADLFKIEKVCGGRVLPTLKALNERGLVSCIWGRFQITCDGRLAIGLPSKVRV